MDNTGITSLIFGLWIGLLLAASVAMELFLQGQVYSNRTATIVLIISISAIFSSAFSWRFFSQSARAILPATLILSLTNIILFLIIGSLVSYIIIVLPHFYEADRVEDTEAFSMIEFVTGIGLGYLGSGFSFKTFGLPLLWPFGVISGFIGTFVFVTLNKMLNSKARH